MNLSEIRTILNAVVLTDEDALQKVVACAYCADLMSDVLSFSVTNSLLITGLTNTQVIRTAEMADLPAILFVRGKFPPPETLQLAQELGIAVMVSPYRMFDCCGRLFQAGLRGLGKVKNAP